MQRGSAARPRPNELRIHRHAELLRQQIRIKRAARKKLPIHFKRGNFPPPSVHAHYQIFVVRRFVNIYLLDGNAPHRKKLFCAPAVRTPTRRIHFRRSHKLNDQTSAEDLLSQIRCGVTEGDSAGSGGPTRNAPLASRHSIRALQLSSAVPRAPLPILQGPLVLPEYSVSPEFSRLPVSPRALGPR